MKHICIDLSKKYDVLIGRNFLKDVGSLILKSKSPGKICLVTDSIVSDLYGDIVTSSLEECGFEVLLFTFFPGENSKTLSTVESILELMASNNFTRSDCIVALGGGIVGDISGFAASVFLRGIDFIQIPTTLLAAVDSSVGGKTGVNLESGKNLAGAFWQPILVLCDCDTFKTLPYDIFLDGISEAIKYGVITNPELFDTLYKYGKTLFDSDKTLDILEDIVATCISIKRDIVSQDERDTGVRQLLNFGHTLGHAIEKCSNYSISHGHAVAIGMRVIAQASFSLGYSKTDCSIPLRQILQMFSLPDNCPFTSSDLLSVALKDKKRAGDSITLVLPITIGDCQLKNIPASKLESFIEAGLTLL